MRDEFLDSQRLAGDPELDEWIAQVFASPDKKQQLLHWLGSGNLNEFKTAYPQFNRANQLPAWADPALMKAGATFFAKHAQMIMNLLGLLSLPYCYTAANGSMV